MHMSTHAWDQSKLFFSDCGNKTKPGPRGSVVTHASVLSSGKLAWETGSISFFFTYDEVVPQCLGLSKRIEMPEMCHIPASIDPHDDFLLPAYKSDDCVSVLAHKERLRCRLSKNEAHIN